MQAHIVNAAHSLCNHRWRWRNPVGFRPVLNLWLVIDGAGSWETKGKHFSLVPGDCFIQRLWQPCYGQASTTTGPNVIWANYHLADEQGFHDLTEIEEVGLPPLHRRVPDLEFCAQLGRRMIDAWRQDSVTAHDWLNTLLLEIKRIDSGTELTNTDPLLQQCIRKIRRHPERQWQVAALAQSCHLSAAQFTRRFKKLTNQTPRSFIQRQRIDRAKELLLMSDFSIGAIAEQIGYQDVFLFRKRFKQQTGVSPSQFRKGSTSSPGHLTPSGTNHR